MKDYLVILKINNKEWFLVFCKASITKAKKTVLGEVPRQVLQEKEANNCCEI